MRRTLILLLSVITLISLVSCAKEGNVLSEYRIYVAPDAPAWERHAAEKLANSLSGTHGVTLEVSEDPEGRTDKELLVGYDNLDEDIKALFDYESMALSGYAIKCHGNKYIITSKTEDAMDDAIKFFASIVIDDQLVLAPGYEYVYKGEDSVTDADDTKHINVSIAGNTGYDIYRVPKVTQSGYRYGPSIIVNDDGTMDAWFAGGGSSIEQWDWIVYKHSEDGGVTWGEEKCVLQPTPNSRDHYSCCDPGVIYFNGYYYLGYTSTLNENQADNSLFVARSENPDGPFDKWNGEGWGGNEPCPIVYFGEDQSLWGVGEVSFVELNGTLYIYYSYKGSDGEKTMVATADAMDENWPAAMELKGVALQGGTNDAIDVKYIDEYGKFIAVASDKRLTEESYLVFYESNDGLHFEESDICKQYVYAFCHNPGLSGTKNGHILSDTKTYVAYAYGPEWGVWNTRFQKIDITLGDEADLTEKGSPNLPVEYLERDDRVSSTLQPVAISTQSRCTMRVPADRETITPTLSSCTAYHDHWKDLSTSAQDVLMYGYDEAVVKRVSPDSLELAVQGVGETMVTFEYMGHRTYLFITVYDTSAVVAETQVKVLEPEIDYNTDDIYQPQIKSIVKYDTGVWKMLWSVEDHNITYQYDETALTVADNGYIIPKKAGTHEITVKAGTVTDTVTVNVTVPDYSVLEFESQPRMKAFRETNNTKLKITDNGKLLCTPDPAEDPYINIDYTPACTATEEYSAIMIKYMIPEENARDSYTGQLFFLCGETERASESVSERFELEKDGKYHELTVDLKDQRYWEGSLNSIRFDFFDRCEEGDTFYIDNITLRP